MRHQSYLHPWCWWQSVLLVTNVKVSPAVLIPASSHINTRVEVQIKIAWWSFASFDLTRFINKFRSYWRNELSKGNILSIYIFHISYFTLRSPSLIISSRNDELPNKDDIRLYRWNIPHSVLCMLRTPLADRCIRSNSMKC